MMMKNMLTAILVAGILAMGCKSKAKEQEEKKEANAGKSDTISTRVEDTVALAAPYATPSAKGFSDVVAWPANKTPTAPAGFSVQLFADDLKNPRWLYIGPNGDIFVAESNTITTATKSIGAKIVRKGKSLDSDVSANQITLLRDTNHDGVADYKKVFLTGLNQPFGMLIMNGFFYVGNTDGIMQFPYHIGDETITGKGKQILSLPKGGYNNHWTRNLFPSKDGRKILVTVGSGSNAGEHGEANEIRRANILEINPDGTGETIYAYGLRNPQGMGYPAGSNTLYTVVNERDDLGDELVPDYFTSVKQGGFYGWPYAYWGQHEDPRLKGQRPDLVKIATVPDISMGAHTASLGLAFDTEKKFTGKYAGGAFIGQHGSWNKSTLAGYQVVFVPFANGKPSGAPQPFLTGFIADSSQKKVYGRPVGVVFTREGKLLVADDVSHRVWSVSATN